MLNQLDGKRKRTILLFLREARLINRQQHVREGRRIYPSIIGLRNADLSNACLRGIQLISTDRKEAVSLEGAILRGADLRCADLERADLRGADLRDACLRGVDADGSGETKRPADLRGADLRDADLGVSEKIKKSSNLSGAKLSGATVQGANLTDAKVANEQLQGRVGHVARQSCTVPSGMVAPWRDLATLSSRGPRVSRERRSIAHCASRITARKVSAAVVSTCVGPLEGGRSDPTSVFSRVPHHTHEHTSRRRGPIYVPPEKSGEDLFQLLWITSHLVWGRVVADIPDFCRELVAALAEE